MGLGDVPIPRVNTIFTGIVLGCPNIKGIFGMYESLGL